MNIVHTYSQDNLPKTIMFLGPKGCGKNTMAKYLSEHVGLELVNIDENVAYEQIEQLLLNPIRKIYFIDLDCFKEKQQNQFLKFIEEPSNTVNIILTATSENNVLPTILSRGIKFHFEEYTTEELTAISNLLNIKTTNKIEIIKRFGLNNYLNYIKKNIIVITFIILGVLLNILLSNMILDIKINHSNKEIKKLIKKDLKEYGLSKYKFKISYEEKELIKEKILDKEKDKIDWLEIEEKGTKYIIKLEERKKEYQELLKEREKLEHNLGGIKEMRKLPNAVFVIDPRIEHNAVAEARKLNIPVFGIVDTNCDPDDVDYCIPANDDAIRSVRLILQVMADAVVESKGGQTIVAYTKDEGEDITMSDAIKVADKLDAEKKAALKAKEEENKEKETEIKIIRIIMVGKLNNIAEEVIRERLRDIYV